MKHFKTSEQLADVALRTSAHEGRWLAKYRRIIFVSTTLKYNCSTIAATGASLLILIKYNNLKRKKKKTLQRTPATRGRY